MNRAALVCGCTSVVLVVAWIAMMGPIVDSDGGTYSLVASAALIAGLTFAGALLAVAPRRPHALVLISVAAPAFALAFAASLSGAIGWAQGLYIGDGLPGDTTLYEMSRALTLISVPLGFLSCSLTSALWLRRGVVQILVPALTVSAASAAALPITPLSETMWFLGFFAGNLNLAFALAAPVCAVVVTIVAAARLIRSSPAPLPTYD